MNTKLKYPKIQQIHQDHKGWLPPRPKYKVLEDFSVTIKIGRSRHTFKIEKNFETDFGSIPRWLWWLLPPMGTYSAATLIHDDLYKTDSDCDRYTSDAVFRIIMIKYHTPFWARVSMHYAVRFFGSYAYHFK